MFSSRKDKKYPKKYHYNTLQVDRFSSGN